MPTQMAETVRVPPTTGPSLPALGLTMLPEPTRAAVDAALTELCRPVARDLASDPAVIQYLEILPLCRQFRGAQYEYEQANAEFRRLDAQIAGNYVIEGGRQRFNAARARLDRATEPYQAMSKYQSTASNFSRLLFRVACASQRRFLDSLELTHAQLVQSFGLSPTPADRVRLAAIRALFKIAQMPDNISGKLEQLLTEVTPEPAATPAAMAAD